MVELATFHVSRNLDECFVWFCTLYLCGASLTEGKIIETIWAILNKSARAVQSMLLANCQETLEVNMGEWNWNKLLNMGESVAVAEVQTPFINVSAAKLIKGKWSKTVKDSQTHLVVYHRAQSAGPEVTSEHHGIWSVQVAEWDRLYNLADMNRDKTGKSNDIFGLEKDKGKPEWHSRMACYLIISLAPT